MKAKIPEKKRALDLVTVGHLIYDSRCYVENFPPRIRTVLIESPIRTSGEEAPLMLLLMRAY